MIHLHVKTKLPKTLSHAHSQPSPPPYTSKEPGYSSATCCTSSVNTTLPAASRGFRCHPVENGGSISKRGKGCASVLRTILSRGRRSSGEKRR